MSKAITYIDTVHNGALSDKVRGLVAAVLRGLDGKTVRIQISPVKRVRSINQNSYYWGVVIPGVQNVFAHYGQPINPEEAHEYCKKEVGKLGRVIATPDSRPAIISRSTADLDTLAFENYLESIRAWAGEYGEIIPLPNEL